MGSKNSGPSELSVLLLARLFPAALTSQRLFRALLLARLEVKRMAFYFFDDVLGLHLALETAQRIFEALTFLNPYFRQSTTPPNRSELDF